MKHTYFSRLGTAAKSTLYKIVFLSVAMLGLGSASAYAAPYSYCPSGSIAELSHSEHGDSLICVGTKVAELSSPGISLEITPPAEAIDQWKPVPGKEEALFCTQSNSSECQVNITASINTDSEEKCLNERKAFYEAVGLRDRLGRDNLLRMCLIKQSL